MVRDQVSISLTQGLNHYSLRLFYSFISKIKVKNVVGDLDTGLPPDHLSIIKEKEVGKTVFLSLVFPLLLFINDGKCGQGNSLHS